MKEVPFSVLEGKTIVSVTTNRHSELQFTCLDDSRYLMYHEQSCCEGVELEEDDGIARILGQPIVVAHVTTENVDSSVRDVNVCQMYTFYTIRTKHDTAVLRWFGASNGYYSVSMSFALLEAAAGRMEDDDT